MRLPRVFIWNHFDSRCKLMTDFASVGMRILRDKDSIQKLLGGLLSVIRFVVTPSQGLRIFEILPGMT